MAATPTRAHPKDAASDLPDVLQFMQLLWAVVHALEKTSKRMAGDLGVTGPQRLALRVVGLFLGVSAGDLAAILHVHPSTLTGVLQRLIAPRWLLRVDDPRDRRRAVLRLTARGGRVNAATRGTVESAVANTLKGVTARDRAATKRVLERLGHHLESAVAQGTRATIVREPDRGRKNRGMTTSLSLAAGQPGERSLRGRSSLSP